MPSQWRYQKQTSEQIYKFLRTEAVIPKDSKDTYLEAINMYQKFCNTFKNYKIPFSFGIDCIKNITEIHYGKAYMIQFNCDEYIFTNEAVYDKSNCMIVNFESNAPLSIPYSKVPQPEIDYYRDWIFQELDLNDIYYFFVTNKLYKNTRRLKFDKDLAIKAVLYYARRCSLNSGHRVDLEFAIHNIKKIEIVESADAYDAFKFYFEKYFYYFGYHSEDSEFGIW